MVLERKAGSKRRSKRQKEKQVDRVTESLVTLVTA